MDQRSGHGVHIPATISAEAAAMLRTVAGLYASRPRESAPTSQADFDAAAERGFALAEFLTRDRIARLAPIVRTESRGGVDVLKVEPAGGASDGAPLVYVHGGGFVQGSARSTLLTAAVAAATSGRAVYSIDYTRAPRADWRAILDEVVSAWAAIAPNGRAGLIGDSAGGCIAAAATLLLRQRGAAMPAAIVLLSPVTDLAFAGDTNTTLAPFDFIDRETMRHAYRAYCPDEGEVENPLVSPVHGDFTAGYPPALIQVGTRETLLSDAVRLHRALRAAGRESRLEPYEGMPHVFQPWLADAPEGKAAWAEIAAFWTRHLEECE